ncbi:hypothetical protein PLESTF_000472500 [Pleodorina starrii]|nr:hypothetical protein PLESTF_000472500 [Pleodorina starrii]
MPQSGGVVEVVVGCGGAGGSGIIEVMSMLVCMSAVRGSRLSSTPTGSPLNRTPPHTCTCFLPPSGTASVRPPLSPLLLLPLAPSDPLNLSRTLASDAFLSSFSSS